MLCQNSKHYTTWKNIPNEDKLVLLKQMSESKNLWLNAKIFSKHKIMLASEFTHLLGDALGPKRKEATTTEKLPTGHLKPWSRQIHHRIKPNSKKVIEKSSLLPKNTILKREGKIFSSLLPTDRPKVSVGIKKNKILSNYELSCMSKGITSQVSASTNKGENQPLQSYPSNFNLIKECTMKPSLDHQYQVDGLHLDNVVIFIVKNYESYLSSKDLDNLKQVNASYSAMILDIERLPHLNFSLLKKPRLDYSTQECISQDRVNLATACLIHYGLHPGMMIQYLKGEYVGKSRDVQKIINKVTPFVCKTDIAHIKRVLTQGCPSCLVFDEARENKLFVTQKRNQHTFLQHPEVAKKTVNKIEKNNHVIAPQSWTVLFSPYLRATLQGMRKKYRKFRVIFDSSMQTIPDEVVLNHITTTDLEAIIDFGQAKMKLFMNIYNWHVSFPNETIYLILADITACSCFPKISADVTGAFGFLAERLYCLSTGHVFGSNTLASSWEALRRAIQNMIPVYSQRTDLVEKRKDLIGLLKSQVG